MVDRPILFSGPMVRAILEGRKTQTRRVISQPSLTPDPHSNPVIVGNKSIFRDRGGRRQDIPLRISAGDRLWVRESWRIGAWRTEQWARGNGECDADVAIDYLADDHPRKEWLGGPDADQMLRLVDQSRDDAEADGRFKGGDDFEYRWSPGQSPCRSRPSIHMPRWASRLTLTVTDVRVQRVQEISEADAKAEGCGDYTITPGTGCAWNCRTQFIHLWDRLNAKRGFGWDVNPWVAAYTFTAEQRNIDADS